MCDLVLHAELLVDLNIDRTSPLYTLNAIWPTTEPVPSSEDVIGGVSAIVWSLTLITLAKYVRALAAYPLRMR